MELKELAISIKETLGLEVVTLASLLTCVNNCFADLHSRGYREFNEIVLSKSDAIEETLTSPALPAYDVTGKLPLTFNVDLIEERIAGKVRTITYLKVKTDEGRVFNVERVNATMPEYKGIVDDEGNYRTDFSLMNTRIAFWQQRKDLTIDVAGDEVNCEEIIIGFTETLKRLPLDSLITTSLDIREDLVNALTLYGVYFYSQKMRMDAELTKEKLNIYKYFVEDMQADLFKEDAYYSSPVIEGGGLYE